VVEALSYMNAWLLAKQLAKKTGKSGKGGKRYAGGKYVLQWRKSDFILILKKK